MPELSRPQITTERLMRLAWGFGAPLIIDAAVRNGIFDALDRSPKSAKELAADLGLSERGASAVAGALVGYELLAKQTDGRYKLAPEAEAFLVSSKPGFHGGLFQHLQSDLIPNWLALAEVTRTGCPKTRVDQPGDGAAFFEGFVDSLFPMNYPAAQALAKTVLENHSRDDGSKEPIKVLDLAAGSGVWGVAMAQASPRVHVTAVDFEPVLPVTRRTSQRFGLESRFNFVAGNIGDANFGRGYSVAILGHILHSEGAGHSRALLKRVFEALRPGGTIAIAEFLVNAEHTGPPSSLTFAVNMLVHTTDGTTFSFEEIGSWLKSEGFENIRLLDVPAPSPLILAERPSS